MPENRLMNVAAISVNNRLRAVKDAWVDALVMSIEENGQNTPILVRRDADPTTPFELIAGAHRLAACRRLGVDVRAEIYDCSDAQARIIEIDENLFRSELNALDRAVSLAERKAIYEKINPDTKRGVAGGKARQNSATDTMSFAEDTAEKINMSPRTIARAVRIANAIPPDLRAALADTPVANNQSDLLTLAAMEPGLLKAVATLIIDGGAKRVGEAEARIRNEPAKNPNDVAFDKLVAAFDRADDGVQKRFLAHLRDTGAITT